MLLMLGDSALERGDSESKLDLLGRAWEAFQPISFQNDPHLIVISLVSCKLFFPSNNVKSTW